MPTLSWEMPRILKAAKRSKKGLQETTEHRIKRPRTGELLPVKRTVKNQKVVSTSNVKVAGRFLITQTLLRRVCR